MTTVIAFPMGRVRPAAATLRADHADVVIFPGVRIERREFKSSAAAPRRKRRSSRARALAAETASEE